MLSELLNHRSLSQVRDPPKLSVQLSYPPLDQHAQDRRDEHDSQARKEESIDSNGIRGWGEHWSNVWLYRAILHGERLVEEDVLDGVERVFLQEADSLDEER